MIETPRALRAEIAVARSSDSPAHNGPTRSFLSVPIRSGTEVFANLYLFERHNGPFTEEDEDLASAFAISAGIAVENARLYDESRRRERWLQASAEISDLLLSPQAGRDPLEEIVETVRNLADADLVSLVIPSVEARALEVAVAAGEGVERLRGMHYSANDTLVSLAVETGRGVRVGAVDEHHQYPVHLTKVAAVGPAMAVPLAGRDGRQGAIVVGRLKGRRAFTSGRSGDG